jgi:enterobactin synthetase component D / holo-[acyl-carrier protein] synthase
MENEPKLIQRMVPAVVRVIEGEGPPQDVSLFPEEAAVIANAVEKRRRDFRAGRACARLALADLGIHDAAIGSGPRREPLWPPGVVGSITHCPGYVAAAVTLGERLTALGIDAEQRGAAGADIESLVCTAAELDRYRRCGQACWRTIVFSAKESLFKALYPLRHFELEFADVEVTLSQDRFSVAPARELGPLAADVERMQGRFLVGDHHVFTAAWLAPDLVEPDGREAGRG